MTASYFEWVQDRQGYFWKESVVNEQLESILAESFDDVVRYSDAHGVNNRIAAYMLAIDRVAFYDQAAWDIRISNFAEQKKKTDVLRPFLLCCESLIVWRDCYM